VLWCDVQGERLEAVHAEEPFLLQVDVKCTSPWQLELTDSRPQLVGCYYYYYCRVVLVMVNVCLMCLCYDLTLIYLRFVLLNLLHC
jgi:hypothetical protein